MPVNQPAPQQGLLLNLGSGQRPFEKPWINVDCQARWDPDFVWDISDMKQLFNDSQAKTIVLHQVLEHFGCGEAKSLIEECYRILAPGGSLIVTIPDIEALYRRWLSGQLTEYLFMVNLMGAYMGDEADRHRWHYSYPGLIAFLMSCAPWLTARRFDWRPLEGASIAQDWWILGLEVTK